jgi:hypothetical protein
LNIVVFGATAMIVAPGAGAAVVREELGKTRAGPRADDAQGETDEAERSVPSRDHAARRQRCQLDATRARGMLSGQSTCCPSYPRRICVQPIETPAPAR